MGENESSAGCRPVRDGRLPLSHASDTRAASATRAVADQDPPIMASTRG